MEWVYRMVSLLKWCFIGGARLAHVFQRELVRLYATLQRLVPVAGRVLVA